ncbi:MAG: RNA polymerase sigma factor [Bacteroidota bacterium]|jgi:RNA polymerase sigma-70 factor (ECF subfamily)
MLHQADDNELVRLFKEHIDREKAFTVIVKRYQEKVYWQIRRLVVSHDDADDVMQHVFIKAWKGLDNFREDAKLYTWLYRIAVNESLSFLEQQKKRSSVSLDDISGSVEQKLVQEKGFDEKEAVWKLQKAIQQLPEKQRAVFNLRYFEEMPYEQMSEVLETSVGALKASYHHAVKKIEDYILHH